MWKRTVCSVLVAAATGALPAHAETLWEFEYTGFRVYNEGMDRGFWPDVSLSGLFEGTDNNGNGVMDFSEVRRFNWDGLEFAKNALPHAGCRYDSCELTSFDFDIATRRLRFSAAWEYVDEEDVIGMSRGYGTVTAGEVYSVANLSLFSGFGTDYVWTDQTRFTISPVPEPSGLALSAAGLLLIGAVRSRRGSRLLWRMRRVA